METKKNIYWVSSFPKSGATWFRFLMYALYHQELPVQSSDIDSFYPKYSGIVGKHIMSNLRKSSPFFIKSHHAYSPEMDLLENIDYVIYLVRDPFNCMMSRYDHFSLSKPVLQHRKDLRDNFIERFISEASQKSEKNTHGGWNYHVLSWLNNFRPSKTLLIKYEDLTTNTVLEVRKLNKRLNLGFSNEEINKAVKLCRFGKMKKYENNEINNKVSGSFYNPNRTYEKSYNRFVNKGPSRNAKENLSEEQLAFGLQKFRAGLELTGYNNIIHQVSSLETEEKKINNGKL